MKQLGQFILQVGLMAILTGCGSLHAASHDPHSNEAVIRNWRINKVNFADVDLGKTKTDAPSGKDWEEFKAKAKSGDEIWYFCAPAQAWVEMMGWRGYAIFRKGRLIAQFTTAEN